MGSLWRYRGDVGLKLKKVTGFKMHSLPSGLRHFQQQFRVLHVLCFVKYYVDNKGKRVKSSWGKAAAKEI